MTHLAPVALLLLMGLELARAEVQVTVSVAPYLGDRQAAWSLTFDDGLRDHLTHAVPAMNQRHLRGTFFIVPGQTPATADEASRKRPEAIGSVAWDEWKAVVAAGHEIANQSWSHPYLTRVKPSRLRREVVSSRSTIKRKLGTEVRAFAFPFDASNEEVKALALQHHPYLRMHWRSCGGQGFSVERVKSWLDRSIEEGEWTVLRIHGIENGHHAFGAAAFSSHLDHLVEVQSKVWVAPFSDVAAYRALREQLKPTAEAVANAQNGAARWLVRCPPPEGVKAAKQQVSLIVQVEGMGGLTGVQATQAGKAVPVSVHARDRRIVVTVPLSAGPVSLSFDE